MKIKSFILNRLFKKRQREIIFQALQYSAHTYKRRGEIEEFSEVARVMEELREEFGLKERTYTKQEVDGIIEESSKLVANKFQRLVEESYRKGFNEGLKKNPSVIGIVRKVAGEEGLAPGMQFSKEQCESCEHKEECSLYAQLKEEFDSEEKKDENAEEEKKESGETEEKKEEQV